MAKKPDTATLIAEAQSKLRDLEEAIAGLRHKRQEKLLADVDAGRQPEAKKIDARIRDLGVEADGVRDLIAALERRAEEERSAKAKKAGRLKSNASTKCCSNVWRMAARSTRRSRRSLTPSPPTLA